MSVSTEVLREAAPSSISPEAAAEARAGFRRDGFFIVPEHLPADMVSEAEAALDRQVAANNNIDVSELDTLRRLQKHDNYHDKNPAVNALIGHPLVGQWAAAASGAGKIQVFATQMLYKPSGLEETGNVGWHQDLEYWDANLVGNMFTIWIALSDVTESSGPMRFLGGTQNAGLLKAGNFFSGDLDTLQANIMEKAGMTAWHETPAIMPAGGFSVHHRLTIHGSGPNTSGRPRKSLAVHVLADNARVRPGIDYRQAGYLRPFDDLNACPIIYDIRKNC